MEPKTFTHPNRTGFYPEDGRVTSDDSSHVRTELEKKLRDYVNAEIKKALLEHQKDETGPSEEQDKDRTVLDKLKRFMAMSSFHGVSHISSSNQLWMRVFWLAFLLAGFGLSGWQIILLFQEYFKYPVLTEVKVHSGNMEYPDVTICNKNPYVLSKVAQHQNFSTHARFTTDFNSTLDIPAVAYQLIEEIDLLSESERIALSHDAAEFIQVRQHDGKTNDNTNPPKLVYERWHGNCFTVTPLSIQDDVYTVFIYVNVNFEEYLNPYREPGSAIFVSEPGTFPFLPHRHGLQVKTGEGLDIHVNLEIMNRLNGSYGNCQDGEAEFEEETGLVYTKEVCKERCRIRKYVDDCECLFRDQEVFSERYKIYRSYPRHCTEGVDKRCNYPRQLPDCSCKPKCHTKNYRITTKKTKMSNTFLNTMCERWHACVRNESGTIIWRSEADYAKYNLACILMVFQDLQYKEFSEIPVYSFWRFLSDLGGSMGLYLGASILTLLEILQCIIGITVFCLCRKRAID